MSTRSSSLPTLLSLPLEIRNHIFGLLTTTVWATISEGRVSIYTTPSSSEDFKSLLKTCRQIMRELGCVLIQRTSFFFNSALAFEQFLHDAPDGLKLWTWSGLTTDSLGLPISNQKIKRMGIFLRIINLDEFGGTDNIFHMLDTGIAFNNIAQKMVGLESLDLAFNTVRLDFNQGVDKDFILPSTWILQHLCQIRSSVLIKASCWFREHFKDDPVAAVFDALFSVLEQRRDAKSDVKYADKFMENGIEQLEQLRLCVSREILAYLKLHGEDEVAGMLEAEIREKELTVKGARKTESSDSDSE